MLRIDLLGANLAAVASLLLLPSLPSWLLSPELACLMITYLFTAAGVLPLRLGSDARINLAALPAARYVPDMWWDHGEQVFSLLCYVIARLGPEICGSG